jgi:D-alanine-D-alanine ligase-like ATP-grasp enzyme
MSKKIAVVRGGTGQARQKSLEYGSSILNILNKFREHHINVSDIVIHPNGAWSMNGYINDISEILKNIDHAWIAIVGDEGESGHISEILEKNNVRIIGHSSASSRISHKKKELHNIVNQHSIKTPYNRLVQKKDFDLQNVLENFKFVGVPSIVKPDSSSGLFMTDLVLHYEHLLNHAEKIINNNYDILIEKHISGISVSVFVYEFENVLQTSIYLHSEDDWKSLKKEDLINVRNEALKIHHSLDFKHHVEYDFIINKNGIYFIEANTYPSLVHDYLKNAINETTLMNYVFYNIRKNLI